ncbi:hypothetical protein SO802_009169 [Lithocarpus litseifolius]|uniref:Uncharacterized protein n=1 Tax=Lithocarpus litseifolius TaxID=425828 RepID=A0AAW2DCU0_9ROSI
MKRASDSDFDSDDDLDREIDEIVNVVPAESRPSTSGAQAAHTKPLAKCARHSVSDSDDDLNREIVDVVAAESKLFGCHCHRAVRLKVDLLDLNSYQYVSAQTSNFNGI